MRLILIRHGQTQSNIDRLLDTGHPGAPLTGHGLGQADALVEKLAGEQIQAVYASDLLRAQQTATPLAEHLGVPLVTHAGLREIFAGEDDMATDWAPYVAMLDAWGDAPDTRLAGGESGAEFLARFDAAVAEVVDSGVECAALVSHGAAMRVWVLARAENVDAAAAREYRLDNTDVLVLEGGGESWRLLRWADLDV